MPLSYLVFTHNYRVCFAKTEGLPPFVLKRAQVHMGLYVINQ